MWRNETKADIKEREALALKKGAKELNSNPYWNPGKHQQTHSVEKGAREYREEQARRKYNEEYEAQLCKDKEKENQDFINKIDSVQNDKNAFTPAKLYKDGIVAREEGNGVKATMHLWQALICGEGKAAYPLFEMLRDGEGGIPKNTEIAGLILAVGKVLGSQECRGYGTFYTPDIPLCRKLTDVYYYSKKFITDSGYKITDEILFEREAAANEALDDFRLQTRACKQPMLDVFQHPIIAELVEKQEVHLAGWQRRNRHNLQFLLYIMTPNFCQPQKTKIYNNGILIL